MISGFRNIQEYFIHGATASISLALAWEETVQNQRDTHAHVQDSEKHSQDRREKEALVVTIGSLTAK